MYLDARIIDRDGQVMGDIVTEGGYDRVVVGTAPFAEEIRETVYQYLGSRFAGIVEQELFPRAFRFAVGVVQSSLD